MCLIRAEPACVLSGFWRGQRLRELEPRLKAGGKYEMVTLTFGPDETMAVSAVWQLVKAAAALNLALGDPTDLDRVVIAKPRSPVAKRARRPRRGS